MVSVRIAAAGAVVVATLCFLTAPVSACDDRYVKRCEKASAAAAAAAAAEAQSESPAAKRKSGRHVRMISLRQSRHVRFVTRKHGPRFADRTGQGGMELASDSSRTVKLPAESALSRRFQGFISPEPIAQNAFEALRKPHVVALNLEPMPILPAVEPSATPAPAVAQADETPPVLAAPKRDKLANEPAEPTVTKPVALADALTPKSVAQVESAVTSASAPAAPQAAKVILTEAQPITPEQPKGFSMHGLVLALCGALGAASALRFIVGV